MRLHAVALLSIFVFVNTGSAESILSDSDVKLIVNQDGDERCFLERDVIGGGSADALARHCNARPAADSDRKFFLGLIWSRLENNQNAALNLCIAAVAVQAGQFVSSDVIRDGGGPSFSEEEMFVESLFRFSAAYYFQNESDKQVVTNAVVGFVDNALGNVCG